VTGCWCLPVVVTAQWLHNGQRPTHGKRDGRDFSRPSSYRLHEDAAAHEPVAALVGENVHDGAGVATS
jgi:hypothetical protein